jgi:hypothetical protein
MKPLSYSKKTSGFSTIEILIAFSVGIIFLASAMMIAFSDPTLAKQHNLDNGQTIALDVILDNNALATSSNKIANAVAAFMADWNGEVLGESDAIYTHEPEVFDISPCMKQITNTTNWDTLNSRSRQIVFGTTLSSMDIASAMGPGGCDPTPPSPNEWDNPDNPNWQTSPNAIDGTQSGLDIATINGTPYAFMVTTHTSQKKDLWVIDVTDSENPVVINSLEVGGDAATKGLVDIDVVTTLSGTFAYVLQNNVTNQLKVIDVSDPTTLTTDDITSTTSLQSYGVNPAGSNPIPKVITYYNDRLYIGLHTTVGPEFLVFSTASDPAHPTFVGAISNSFDHSINDITINGDYAYLAIAPGSPPSGSATKELLILNISGSTPINTGLGFNASSTANDTEAATTLYLIGNKLYMGRERVSNASERDFYVFNVSSSTYPRPIKSKRLGIPTGGSLGTPRVLDLVVHGKLGFIVTTDSSKPFIVYDVVSSPTDILQINTVCDNYLNLPKLIEIIYKNGLVYAANGNQAALNILYDKPSICGI